jgi:aminoglycoside phosphotransferase (APT) family kinase protein
MDANSHYSGTTRLPPDAGFTAEQLDPWLHQHVEGYAGPLGIEQFKGGQSNPTYRLTTPGRRYVMRSKPAPAARLLRSAHAVEREARVMAALAGTGVPVPQVHGICEDESVIGRAFFIMECVEGRVLWDQALPGMSPTERGAIWDETNRVIALLHKVKPESVGLADFGRPGNYFARQIDRWSRQNRASETEPIAAMDQLMAWLPTQLPPDEESCIVHGDFRLDNLILHPHEPRALAVLDWELSTLGHPLADFAYHCLAWHIAPGEFRGIAGLDLKGLGIPDEAAYVRRYCERTGRDAGQVLERWDFYIAFNLFRLAAILQGIMKRVVDGTASSAQAAHEGARARGLAEKGWSIAQRGR